MTIEKAELLVTKPLNCGNCLLSNKTRPCHKVVEAVIAAAVHQDPTVDIPGIGTEERVNVSQNLLASIKYQETVRQAGELACKSSQQFYNRTVAQGPLAVMI